MEETLIKLCKTAQLLESHVDPNSDEFIFVGNFVSALLEAAQSWEELAQNFPDLARELNLV